MGCRRIRAELARAGVEPPATSTIHRTLTRHHLVAPRPPRRRPAKKRFERPVPNDLWQIDATQVKFADGERVWVVDIVDDHARYLLAAHACEALSGEAVWACFVTASAAYGLPRQLLSDNGTYFTGRLHGVEVAFERRLAEVGVELICAAPIRKRSASSSASTARSRNGCETKDRRAISSSCRCCSIASAPITTSRVHTKASVTSPPAERYLPTTPLG